MVSATIPSLFLTGNHAGRPAANAVGSGALYSCTTHSLIYQSDGSSWSTWATLGGGANVEALPTAETDTSLVLAPDGAGGVEFRTEAGSGSGTSTAPHVKRVYAQSFTNGTSHAPSITAASAGDRIIVCVSSYNRDVNSISCTNVTFTEVLAANFSTGAYLSCYVGVVAGGSSGTTVTISCTGSDFIIADIYVVADALSPTAGASATLTDTDASSKARASIGPVSCSVGDFFIMAAAENNGTVGFSEMRANALLLSTGPRGGNDALTSAIGRASDTTVAGWYLGGTSGGDLAAGVVIVS